MSAKRTTWNEFSLSMALAVICLSTGRKFNLSKYIFDSLVRNIDSSTKFYMYLQFLQLMIRAQVGDLSLHTTKYSSHALTQKVFANKRRVGKGFFEVDTPLFKGIIVAQQADEGAAEVNIDDVPIANVAAEGAASVVIDDVPGAADEPTGRQAESQGQIYQIDLEHADKVLSMHDDKIEPSELKEVVEVVTTAKHMTKVITVTSATTTTVDTLIYADVITTAPSAARRRKRVVIRDPKETATPSTIIYVKPKSKDKGKRIMVYEPKPLKKKTQIEALKRKVESLEDEAAKKQKLDEEVAELRKHLQIVPNDDDDVYIKATPIALKVPVFDYEIYTKNNKPYYKIKRSDGTHQLYLSFLSMLRNFDKKDLEVLWKLVKEIFASSKPKNFSDDFLLTIVGDMFEKPDVQA
uniref:Uncharacterized protein n=1 Tax=Tanacetum cinerariifolium TaxID=118510 RepID=A0A699GKH2_TANCI|nr:hypothetical protein [Tanacetum cinerariifolium]